jgi:hypothetical protein
MLGKILRGCLAIIAIASLLLGAIVARHIVYWSPHEDVSFPSGDIELAGTVVKPSGDGRVPAIVMLHGSGREPRTDPSTRPVVNALVRAGFAVLAYDKRGVGASGGDFDSALYRDFIADGVAAVHYMAARPDVDPAAIGLYAVSEGGWLAPEIAVNSGRIRFIFNKVGSPLSFMETVAWEVRNDFLAAGIAAEDVQALVDVTVRRWRFYIDVAADPSLANGEERHAINARLATLRREVAGASEVLAEKLGPYDAVTYAAYAADLAYDPSPFLRQLDIPLYYAYGGQDINVPTDECVAELQRIIAAQGKDIGITVYPHVGHTLVTWRGLLTMGYVPGYLETLSRWTSSQVRPRQESAR